LGLKAAEGIYKIFGKNSLPAEVMPVVNTPVWDTLGYHIRSGKHDITGYDWDQYLNFGAFHLT
jgi:hypothetical protein